MKWGFSIIFIQILYEIMQYTQKSILNTNYEIIAFDGFYTILD